MSLPTSLTGRRVAAGRSHLRSGDRCAALGRQRVPYGVRGLGRADLAERAGGSLLEVEHVDGLRTEGVHVGGADRDVETTATSVMAAMAGLWCVRVHDVASTVRALTVVQAALEHAPDDDASDDDAHDELGDASGGLGR